MKIRKTRNIKIDLKKYVLFITPKEIIFLLQLTSLEFKKIF